MAQISKKEQILQTASKLFLQEGFHSVSMDAIATAVPVSKPTLYNNFSDKKDLFSAVISLRCQEFLAVVEKSVDTSDDITKVLKNIGRNFLNMILSPDSLHINRIITSECEKFPEMAKMFYESGPKKALAFLTLYLENQNKKGTIKVINTELSANMFLSMLKGQWHMQCMLGLRDTIPAQEQEYIIDYAVSLFLRAHVAAN